MPNVNLWLCKPEWLNVLTGFAVKKCGFERPLLKTDLPPKNRTVMM